MKNLLWYGLFMLSLKSIPIRCLPNLGNNDPPRRGGTCQNPSVRTSWENLSSSEKRSYQESIACLIRAPSQMRYPGAVTRYDDLVYVHQKQSDYPNGRDLWHVTGQFLSAHRLYCYVFELMLRQECNYQGRMPYWNEMRDAGNFRNSQFLRDFGGPGDSNGRVVQGPFASFQISLGPGFQNVKRTLRRAVNETASAMAGRQFYNNLMAQSSFAGFLNEIRHYNHIAGHNGVGGELGDVQTAPVDVIFFCHHFYIDFLWATWQKANPAARIFDLRGAGYETQADPNQETNFMTPISFLGLAPDVPLYGSLDIQGGFLCYTYEWKNSCGMSSNTASQDSWCSCLESDGASLIELSSISFKTQKPNLNSETASNNRFNCCTCMHHLYPRSIIALYQAQFKLSDFNSNFLPVGG